MVVCPPVGGDTQWINLYQAYESLSAPLKDMLEGLTAIHVNRYGTNHVAEHPVVRVHPETGNPSLYSTFGYIIGIEGMGEDEGNALLGEMYAWQTREEFQYCHKWQPHMLVMWDNRAVLHRATSGYDGHDRLLHRTTIGFNPEVRAAVSSPG